MEWSLTFCTSVRSHSSDLGIFIQCGLRVLARGDVPPTELLNEPRASHAADEAVSFARLFGMAPIDLGSDTTVFFEPPATGTFRHARSIPLVRRTQRYAWCVGGRNSP